MKINMPYTGGVPDLWYSGAKADLWVEYKWEPKLPKLDTAPVRINLSSLQQFWLAQRYYENRNVAVVLGHPDGAFLMRGLEWMRPWTSLEVRQQSTSVRQLAEFIHQFTTGNVIPHEPKQSKHAIRKVET